MKFLRLVGLIVTGWGLLVSHASACSLVESLLEPSNYDLVKEADAIVLARATSVNGSSIFFTPFKDLKGRVNGVSLEFPGVLSKSLLKETKDFSESHHDVCGDDEYQLGALYVLFLTKEKGGWIPFDTAFARTSEFVASEDSDWIKAVKEYITISSIGNPVKEKTRLRQQIALAIVKKNDRYEQLLAKDIQRGFGTPYPTKSFSELLSIYGKVKNKEWDKFKVFFAMAKGKYPEAQNFFLNLIDTMKLLHNPASYEKHLAHDAIGLYIENTDNSSMMDAIIAKYQRINRPYELGFPFIEYAIKYAGSTQGEFMLEQMQRYLASNTQDDNEAWASDVSTWFVGKEHGQAVAALKKTINNDYASHERLAIALARLGDAGTFSWANKNISASSIDRNVALQVVGAFPSSEAKSIAERVVISGNSTDAISLINGCRRRTIFSDCMGIFETIADRYAENKDVMDELTDVLSISYRVGKLGDTGLLQRLDPEELERDINHH